ncbi:MAG: ribosome-associated translation inhibitor RaiA [Ignavibacteriales bacterium]|nr:ribosome-associated translation inhibitor RaiA [Ignavibacteriales bacterium]
MNIKITSRKFKAKDSLKEFITGELKSLQKLNDDIMDANAVLSFTHQNQSIKTAEIKLNIPGTLLIVTESTDDFAKSVDIAVAKLKRQLRKLKTKRIDTKR